MNNLVTKMIPQSLIFTVLRGAWFFLGCATTHPSQPSKVVPISDFSSVAGKWAGTFWLDPRDYEDWVELQINPDGSYEYSSVNEWGAMLGSDRFSLRDLGLAGLISVPLQRTPRMSHKYGVGNGNRIHERLALPLPCRREAFGHIVEPHKMPSPSATYWLGAFEAPRPSSLPPLTN